MVVTRCLEAEGQASLAQHCGGPSPGAAAARQTCSSASMTSVLEAALSGWPGHHAGYQVGVAPRPGCPRRRLWTLPSTSGGHDPISTARGRDRCFLPGQARDWGAVCKSWVGGRPGRRGAPEQGEPGTQPAHSQQAVGQSPAPLRGTGNRRIHSLTRHRPGRAVHAKEVGAAPVRGRGLDVLTRD